MKLLSFTDKFYEAKNKVITFTFGRFQPPTIGHEKLFDKVKSVAVSYTHLTLPPTPYV